MPIISARGYAEICRGRMACACPAQMLQYEYMGPIGIQELVLIFIVALLVFGPKKLPELGRSLGKTLAEFKRASNEIKHNIEKELEEEEKK